MTQCREFNLKNSISMKKNQISASALKALSIICGIFFMTPVMAQTDWTAFA